MAAAIVGAIKIVVITGNQKRALIVAVAIVVAGPGRTTQAIDPSSNPLQTILLGLAVAVARAVRRALLIIIEWLRSLSLQFVAFPWFLLASPAPQLQGIATMVAIANRILGAVITVGYPNLLLNLHQGLQFNLLLSHRLNHRLSLDLLQVSDCCPVPKSAIVANFLLNLRRTLFHQRMGHSAVALHWDSFRRALQFMAAVFRIALVEVIQSLASSLAAWESLVLPWIVVL